MDEYLSEKEQIEQIKQWWRENGWYLIGGALLVVVGFLGYRQYNAYQDNNALQASVIKSELERALADDDREGADRLLAQLTSDYPKSPYTSQARFLLADEYLIRDTDRAVNELTEIVEQSDDPELANVARSRLARALAYDEQYERALQALDVEDSGQFAARFSEIRGDILAASGDREGAELAYTEALISPGTEYLNRELLQLKLGDLLPAEEPAGSTEAVTAPADESEPESEPEFRAEPESEPEAAAQTGVDAESALDSAAEAEADE